MDATSSIQRWHGGALSAPAGIEADAQDQLQLSDAQFQRRMALGEPDIMFTLLMDKTSELEPGSGRGAFRARLQRILATASQLTVAQTPDRLQFVVLSLACGENFHTHPGLQATWRNIRERGARLEQAWAPGVKTCGSRSTTDAGPRDERSTPEPGRSATVNPARLLLNCCRWRCWPLRCPLLEGQLPAA